VRCDVCLRQRSLLRRQLLWFSYPAKWLPWQAGTCSLADGAAC
jgi:hypothetical protein